MGANTPMRQPPLMPVSVEAGGAEGDPHLVYTWQGHEKHVLNLLRSYIPSGGGVPRLVATLYGGLDRPSVLGVWDTGTGAFLGALEGSPEKRGFGCLVSYQRASDGRPRVATGCHESQLSIWDGDDHSLQHTVQTHPTGYFVGCLAVYEEPTGQRLRLVSG
jgi:WD40 repeat protein